MAQIDLRHASIRIADGGGHFIDVKIGEGDLSYTEKRQIDPVKSRGVLDTMRENEEEPVEVSMGFIWDHITSGSGEAITVEDALKKRNGASGWVSVSSDVLAPYCVNLVIIDIPPCSGVQIETITLGQFNHTDLAHSLKDGTVALKGICNVKQASSVRS